VIRRFYYILTICATVILIPDNCQSQNCNAVEIKAPSYLLLRDTAIHILHDTTARICEQYILLTEQNGYHFYSKLNTASDKHLFLKDIYKMVLASPPPDTVLQKQNMIKAEDVYQRFSGKPISKIRIKVLKPFGPTIADTNRPVITYVERSLNPTHFISRDWVIRNKLLFNEKDTINPLLMVENTRLLADLSYLQDAAIIVSPAQGDSVEVLVLVKDKFPWLVVPNIISSGNVRIYGQHANIFGLGQSVGFEGTYMSNSTPMIYLSRANYSVDNVYDQVGAELNYEVDNNNQLYQVRFDRKLIPNKVNLGGGLEISQTSQNIITDPTYVNKSLYYFKYMLYDAWASYLFPARKILPFIRQRALYIIPGISYSKKNYSEYPWVNIDSSSQFYNYDMILGNIVLAKQGYYRTNYLTNFGKAEYLPYGFQASITTGYSWTDFMKKPYMGLGFYVTTHINKVGFIFGKLDAGSHLMDRLQQGAVSVNVLYLTDLLETKRNKFRMKSEISFTTGINRFTNDLLYLGEAYGFLGLKKESFYGQQRLFMETSVINYTSLYFAGFRLALIGFVSAGTIGPHDTKLVNRRLVSSFGAGVYVQNDFLVFSSVEFKVAYFPVTPPGVSHFGLTFSSENLLNRINFLVTKPRQVAYQ